MNSKVIKYIIFMITCVSFLSVMIASGAYNEIPSEANEKNMNINKILK